MYGRVMVTKSCPARLQQWFLLLLCYFSDTHSLQGENCLTFTQLFTFRLACLVLKLRLITALTICLANSYLEPSPFHIKFMEKYLAENKGSTLCSSLRAEVLSLRSSSSSDFLWQIESGLRVAFATSILVAPAPSTEHHIVNPCEPRFRLASLSWIGLDQMGSDQNE